MANKGKASYWKNKHISEKTRNKISKSRLKRGIKGNTIFILLIISTVTTIISQEAFAIADYIEKMNYEVITHDDGVKEFKSGAEIARYFGISPAYINNCIKHNRPYKGFKIIQKNKGC